MIDSSTIALIDSLRDAGLGVLIFILWYFSSRRQRSLEELIRDYRDLAKLMDDRYAKTWQSILDINKACREELQISTQKTTELIARLDRVLIEMDRLTRRPHD